MIFERITFCPLGVDGGIYRVFERITSDIGYVSWGMFFLDVTWGRTSLDV